MSKAQQGLFQHIKALGELYSDLRQDLETISHSPSTGDTLAFQCLTLPFSYTKLLAELFGDQLHVLLFMLRPFKSC